jgi:hypothetical protein
MLEMGKDSFRLVVILVILGSMTAVSVVVAACPPNQLTNPLNPTCDNGCDGFTCVLSKIINFIFELSIPLTAIMVLYGGLQFMTSAGNPEKLSRAKQTLTFAVVGFITVLLAGGVASLIKNIFGG